MKREDRRFGFGSTLLTWVMGLSILLAAAFAGPAVAEDTRAIPVLYPPGNAGHFSGDGYDGLYAEDVRYDILYQQTSITVEAWIKWETTSVAATIFEFYTDDVSDAFDGYKLKVYPPGCTDPCEGLTFEVGNHDDEEKIVAYYSPGMWNDWHHVAATFDGSQMKLFLDGKAVGANFSSRVGADSNHNYKIYVGANFGGYIDEVRVWSKVLTEQQIADNMHTIRWGNEEDLSFYLRFDEMKTGSGSYFEDLTGKHTLDAGTLPVASSGLTCEESEAGVNRIPEVEDEGMEAPGNALRFDGSDDYVGVGPFDELLTEDGNLKSFTFEAWVALVNPASTSTIISSKDGDFKLWVNGIGKQLTATVGGTDVGDPSEWPGDVDFDCGTWLHTAAVYNASTGDLKLYKNGEEVASGSAGAPAIPDPSILLGAVLDGSVGTGMQGVIDEARIWSVARTGEQIRSKMGEPLQGTEGGLVGYYRFDHSSRSLLADSSSSEENHSGLLVNMDDEDWVTSRAAVTSGDDPGWVYYDKNGTMLVNPTEDQIETQAYKREYVSIGALDYALFIDMDHTEGKGDGANDEFGNPVPAKGKTWIAAGETVSVSLNGIVLETNNINLRYVLAEYEAAGAAGAGTTQVALTDLDEDDVLVLAEFEMNDWAEILFTWKSQYKVAVSTLPVDGVADLPLTEVTDGSGQDDIEGSGFNWYNKGTELKFTATDGCLDLKGYKVVEEGAAEPTSGYEFTRTVEQNYSVVWEYETPIYEEVAYAGSPIAFYSVPVEHRDKLLLKPGIVRNVNDPNEDPSYLTVWNEAESKLFPTVGEKELQLEYPMGEGACFDKMVVRVTVKWPPPHYVHMAGSPPVNLEPSTSDWLHFMDMKHTTGDAVVTTSKEFTALESGYSTLYFSGTHAPAPAPFEVSLWFDGADDRVDCGEILPESYRIEAWIKIDSTGGRGDIASGSTRHAFYVENGTLKAARKNSSGGWDTVSAGAVTPGQWTNVSVSYSGGTLTVNNGGATQSTATDSPATDRTLFLGALGGSSNHFRGQIDEVKVTDLGGGGVVAYYKMDRAGESYLHDSSSRGYHAAMLGMNPHQDVAHLEFHNSDNNYVQLPDLYSGGDLTVEGWVLLEERISNGVFFEFSNGGSDSVYLTFSDGATGKPEFGTTTSSSVVSEEPFPLNSWTHIAATYDSSDDTARIYINGVQTAVGTVDPPALAARPDSFVGGKPSGNTCEAIFRDVRIWGATRSRANISASMSATLSGDEEDLLAVYQGNDKIRGTTLVDSSDNDNHAELVDWSYPSSWIAESLQAFPIAQGDPEAEFPIVRIVETSAVGASLAASDRPARIGRELVSILHDPDAEAPHIYYSLSRYNTQIYGESGQIFPVNRQFTDATEEDDLLIVWRRSKDGISWPENPVKYSCVWPDDAKRIVIASRHGSESMDDSENDPRYPDSQGSFKPYFEPARYSGVMVYYQNDPEMAGYNPNEEHALAAASFRYSTLAPRPKAAFALRNDLNVTTQNESYTSDPRVLVQYYDEVLGKYGMEVYTIETEDPDIDGYTFVYPMEAGEILVAPYPVNTVIGAVQVSEHIGKNGNPLKRCYWEDHKEQAWAVSGDSFFTAAFWYPLAPSFWYNRDPDGDGEIETTGQVVPWLWDGTTKKSFEQLAFDDWKGLPTKYAEDDDPDTVTHDYPMPVICRFETFWPDETPVLKAGETVTFSGGEYRADNPDNDGLPMALAWAAGQVVYDDVNQAMNKNLAFNQYLVRLAQVLEKRGVTLDALPEDMEPASGRVKYENGVYYFKEIHAGLQKRVYYDPLNKELCMLGFVNDKTLGDETLTASPPSVYVLQPNIMTERERDDLKALQGADTDFQNAVDALYELTRNPNQFPDKDYTVGLQYYTDEYGQSHDDAAEPLMALGPGLALFPNQDLLTPGHPLFSIVDEGYVTVAENNHPDMGALPVALHIVKVVNDKYRGAIKRVLPDNAFDEKVVMRHTADFGANQDSLVFQWWYREDDGEDQPPPEYAPDEWAIFPDPTGNSGLGAVEVTLAGTGKDLLVDNFFFTRYRHKDCVPDGFPEVSTQCWSEWAGAANSRPPDPTAVPPEDPAETYQAQLCEGWIKRVMQAINPFEARITDFYSTESPATYTSMIQQAGPRYEGAVAFNPDKDVIENVGLIELYQTVLDRGTDLTIDLTQPDFTSAVCSALQLAASRIAALYTLLGNEAYTDSLDPTIGFDTESGEYGSLAPTIFTFMNQVPTLIDEELALLRGIDEEGARPGYNRLLWNFTNDQGEVAYALSYNISDVTLDGFINEADGRTLYPQAHGDAWGHYLTALKVYYDLLTHPEFNWISRAESFYIEGVVVEVDYLDERKFAEIAAAKAKAGAEILDLTYRSKYTENPDGQWQGYRDTDEYRAWGVEEWAQRSFMGAWFDYATACAMLPDVDEEHDGMKKIDRITVTEIQEIAGQARRIQQKYDEVNTGLNPLGLATSAVPFDINPSQMNPSLTNKATHYEQVAVRAKEALENALVVFDNASDLKNRIRQVATSTAEFKEHTDEQDRDYRNRLIEIFGTPYEGTIGTGKVYPAGYKGPDYYLYNYVDVNEVSEDSVPPASDSFTAFFKSMNRTFIDPDTGEVGDGDLASQFSYYFEQDITEGAFTSLPSDDVLEVEMPYSATDYSFVAPEEWGMRKSPGEIQQVLIELVKAETDYKMAIQDYLGYIGDVTSAIDIIEATSDLHAETIRIGDEQYEKQKSLNDKIKALRTTAAVSEFAADEIRNLVDATIEGVPKIAGLSNDVSAPLRSALKYAYLGGTAVLKTTALTTNLVADGLEMDKEYVDLDAGTALDKADYKYDIQQQLKELEGLLGGEVNLRLEIFKRKEARRQIGEKYRAVLAKGLRLMEERKAFNARVAAKTQGQRYRDMAFRTSLNDALSMYRQSFDLAARYVYLAAKAYDYETNLSHEHPASAIPLMTDIVKQRTLGEYKDGEFVFGQGGLGDVMTYMDVNFASLKTQMGIDNPQQETGRFSLRYELMRVMDDDQYDGDWRGELRKRLVDDLWDVTEFRNFCRPFAPESDGEQPGLIVEFSTQIMPGKNVFGNDLGGGDHAYDASNFATKVRSVGVWFEGYDNSLLSETPRVYLVPVGMDIMYVADSDEFDTREWQVIDQRLPTPLPVRDSNLSSPDFVPSLDGLDGSMIEIRRFSTLLAYHDAGYLDETEMNYSSRIVGRSVWNTRWMLIIPGGTFHYDAEYGLDTFVDTVKDIKLFFETYAISGA